MDPLAGVLVSSLMGGLLGLERSFTKKQELAGARTFALFCLLGFLTSQMSDWLSLIVLAVLAPFVFYLFVREKRIGLTTSTTLVLSYVLGVALNKLPTYVPVGVSVLVAIINAEREVLRSLSKEISKSELINMLEFLLIAFFLIPLVPEELTIGAVSLRPTKFLEIVTLVCAISFAGYIMQRLKAHNLEIWCLLGGSISSFTVHYYAKKMKSGISTASVLSFLASFSRNVLLLLLFFPALGWKVIPYYGIVVAMTLAFLLFREKGEPPQFYLPFSIKEAFKIAALTFGAIILSDLVRTFLGSEWYVFSLFLVAPITTLGAVSSIIVLKQMVTPLTVFWIELLGQTGNVALLIKNKKADKRTIAFLMSLYVVGVIAWYLS